MTQMIFVNLPVPDLQRPVRFHEGAADPSPVQEHGFMYGRSFADPDGHIWELAWMDMEAALARNAMADA